jgi:RHS repeat-associated protein
MDVPRLRPPPRHGRLHKEINHLNQEKIYNYYISSSENRITREDEDLNTIEYLYDDLYRLTQITYPNSSNWATFGYDDRGNMTSAANQHITYSPILYDLNNRLTDITDSNGKTVSYHYNSLNQRTQMVADGREINYTYDNGNRLYQVISPNPLATIMYDLAGRRQTLSYPNQVTTTYTFNKAGFLTNLLTQDSQQTGIISLTYTLDGMGNRYRKADHLAGYNVDYNYDGTYQLTTAQSWPLNPYLDEYLNYDPVGNREWLYEVQGPILGGITEYVYDFENRLTEVNYTGKVAQYKYDPFGRRIEKNVNNSITRYLYDGPNIAAQYDGTGTVTAKYIHTLDIDDPLTVTQGANTFYYHRDGLGSVVNLTDASGYVVKSYTYKSFGEIYSETGSLVQPFTFTGREYDSESGLYYYRARYYDPRAGRFLTKDPIGFPGGDFNLYRYVFNNPVNLIDPQGKAAIGAIIGLGIGIVSGASGAIAQGGSGFDIAVSTALGGAAGGLIGLMDVTEGIATIAVASGILGAGTNLLGQVITRSIKGNVSPCTHNDINIGAIIGSGIGSTIGGGMAATMTNMALQSGGSQALSNILGLIGMIPSALGGNIGGALYGR